MELKKAQRKNVYLKLGIASPSGAGKTAGSLLIAYGLMHEKHPTLSEEELWAKIAIIDTENGSGELYVDTVIGGSHIGIYNAITLAPPFTAEKYIKAIKLCEKSKIEVTIIDSTTHLWSGEGGLLEQQNNASTKPGNNSWTGWREITPMHNEFVSTMLQCSMHVIATMRSKQEYAQEKDDRGKNKVVKLGMEPEQRKGMEYEFTTFLDIDSDHIAFGSKDRTSTYDQKKFKITPEVGENIMKWLKGATNNDTEVIASMHEAESTPVPKEVPASKSMPTPQAPVMPKANTLAEKVEAITGIEDIASVKEEVIKLCKIKGGASNKKLVPLLKEYSSNGNPNAITDLSKLIELRNKLNQLESI